MRKKIMLLLFSTMVVQSLVGCTSASSKLVPIEKIPVKKACFITDRGEIKDKAFNEQIWSGLKQVEEEEHISIEYVETKKQTEIKPAMEKMLNNGNQLLWGNGETMAQVALELAPDNKQVFFGVVDVSLEKAYKNTFGIVFRDQESAFLAGYIAACTTKQNHVSFIGGEKNSTIESFEWGFKGGVAYASKRIGKTIQVDTVYIDTFSNIEEGKKSAKKLYNEGSDIILCAAGKASYGAIEAAKEQDKWIIGVDQDPTEFAPSHVLVSTLKNVDVAIVELTKAMAKGGFIGGQNFEYGLSNGSVGISENNGNVETQVYENALKLKEDIEAGYVIAPVNESEYRAYNEMES